jgi:hypothetical protein
MNEQRKRVWIFVALGLVIGTAVGFYTLFRWVIPLIDTVVFPWMAHLERTLGRAGGLAVVLVIAAAAWGALIALWVRYARAVRARQRELQQR